MMNTEGLKVLKARLWDQRLATRDAIKGYSKSTALSQLDDLFLIENEMLEEFDRVRDEN